MKVGIAGAGAIAMGYAAFLLSRGHSVDLWSPSGIRTAEIANGGALKVSGPIEGEFYPGVIGSAAELAVNDVIVFALPAYGQRSVIDALAPHLEPRHTVILSAHLSFAALYLAKRVDERGFQIPIIAWNTTALTCKAKTFTDVRIGALRKMVSVTVLPEDQAVQGADLCRALFGERFTLADDLLTITLSNLNPQSHLAIALCNLTRMERGETWGQRENITATVGRFIEALDAERRELAAALNKPLGTVFDHYRNSFGLEGSSVAEMSARQVELGADVAGPKAIDSRYVLEDVPFGLVPLLHLADIAGVDIPLHRSGVTILSACYGKDFKARNDLLPAIADLEEVLRS